MVVLGAGGGCGSAAVQVAKAAGATVIAVAGGVEKCALAERLGADTVLDHRTVRPLSEAVKEHTGGRGVDLVFDTVGGADVKDRFAARPGTAVTWSSGSPRGDPSIRANQAILKCFSIVGVAYGTSAIADPVANVEDFRQLFDWYRQGRINPAIGHRFPLAETAEAMGVVFERRAVEKVVIEMAT